jgi:hypothetical protein
MDAVGFSGVDIVSQLPAELALRIFGYLSPEELGRVARVCKAWKVLADTPGLWRAFNMEKYFPLLKVIDGAAWERYLGLVVHDEPALNKRALMPILTQFSALPIEGNAGFTLFTMPKEVSLNTLRALAGTPKEGNPTVFRYIHSDVLEPFGDMESEETKVVLISNALLDGSCSLSAVDQQRFLQEIGCKMADFVTMVALPVMTHIISGKRLFNTDRRDAYARCVEKVNGYRNVIVGGFAPTGLYVDDFFYLFNDPRVGVAAMRKF